MLFFFYTAQTTSIRILKNPVVFHLSPRLPPLSSTLFPSPSTQQLTIHHYCSRKPNPNALQFQEEMEKWNIHQFQGALAVDSTTIKVQTDGSKPLRPQSITSP
ncbi:hypothetical protein FXO38_25013, partial [Capsicum annuum]